MLPATCRNYSQSPISPPNLSPPSYVRRLNSSSASTLRHSTPAVYFTGNDIILTKLEEIELVLQKGADVNVKNKKQNGRTFLGKAASDGGLALVNLLLKYDADVNIPDNEGNTPLMALAKRTIVKQGIGTMFLEPHDQLSPEDWKVLEAESSQWNSMSSEDHALTGIRSKYFNPREGDFYKNNFEIARQLIAHGANIQAKNHAGETARMLAIKQAAPSDYNLGVLDAINNAQQAQNVQTSPISRFFKRLLGDKITKKLPVLTGFVHN